MSGTVSCLTVVCLLSLCSLLLGSITCQDRDTEPETLLWRVRLCLAHWPPPDTQDPRRPASLAGRHSRLLLAAPSTWTAL